MKNLKKIAASALTLVLSASISMSPVFAESPATAYTDGSYTGTIHVYQNGVTDFKPENYSMCDVLFAREVDIKLESNSLKLDTYVACPVPNMPSDGPTVTDVKMTHNDTEYTADSDMQTKPKKLFDREHSGFGIVAGQEYPTQKLSFSLPREAIDTIQNGIKTSAVVSAMGMTQQFIIKITDIKSAGGSVPDGNTTTETKEVTVSANVVAPGPTYEVQIPGEVVMGDLSADKANVKEYTVDVTANNIGNGHIEISTASEGVLKSGSNQLKYTNSFTSENITTNKQIKGTFTVSAEEVKKATAGTYTGTATFTIKYFPGK